jgi:hypothetical protein
MICHQILHLTKFEKNQIDWGNPNPVFGHQAMGVYQMLNTAPYFKYKGLFAYGAIG